MPQLTPEAKKELEHQQYRLVGAHSAVKICGWTKSMIRGQGSCYKHKFYGIRSSQCLQMTTSLSCANRCIFCWRGYKAPVGKEWKWPADGPQAILDGCLKEQQKLLVGFFGSETADRKLLEESKTVKHAALSLTGEPIIYPKINELLELFNQNKISTFLVTNGQYPKEIRALQPVTQLYLSLDAPTPMVLKEIDQPLFPDFWERLLQSLDELSKKKQRTCIRLTIIKGINDSQPEKYAELIQKGSPDFVEVKAYMFLGQSRQRLKEENMPFHDDIAGFSRELAKFLPDHEIASEHAPSRVVLLAKKKYKVRDEWQTWIDFERWFEGERRDYSAQMKEITKITLPKSP